jgi:hypothetical protein
LLCRRLPLTYLIIRFSVIVVRTHVRSFRAGFNTH